MQIRVKLFHLLVCCLLSLACDQRVSRSSYPAPPATSYRVESIDFVMGDTSHSIRGAFITPDFIKAVREQPLLGRHFLDQEYKRNSQQVAVVSYKLWQQWLKSNPRVIGKALELNGQPYTVIGIMPKGFFPEGVDIWLPEAETGR